MNEQTVKFGEADLTNCDREPIHIPGSIYPHGVMLVVDRQGLGVEQVAGDTRFLLGIDPDRVLGLSVSTLLETDVEAFVAGHLDSPAAFVAPTIRLGVRSRSGSLPLDLTLHAVDRTAIIELEPARRTTTSAGDPIAQLKTLLAALQGKASVAESCHAAAVAMRAATGFDRAMVYRFLPDDSGEVVAEDARAGLESYLGLHYPASDIPKQARELYRRNWLRAIPDVDYVAAPLKPQTNRRTGKPIDMSHCALRSVSPIHLEYLRNMGVSASLSASIVCQDRLWGMLVLHHYTPRHASADLRVACEAFAQMFSLHIEARAHAETQALRIEARRSREFMITRFSGIDTLAEVLATPELLSYLGATGAAVYLDGRLARIGETPEEVDIMALVSWLNSLNEPVFATEQLSAHYPAAAGFSRTGSGLLALGISREPRDYVLWFRPDVGRTVRWAGEPAKQVKVDRHGVRLTPRGSFAEWLEEKKMQSHVWSDVDLEAAHALRVVLLESILKSVDMAQRERAFAETRAMAEELESRVKKRTEQLHALASELEAVEDRERRQIARDLHDDLGQTLAAARIRLASLCNDKRADVRKLAQEIDMLVDKANQSTRSLAAQLAPAVLYELGLIPALDSLGEEISRTYGLKVAVTDDGQAKPLSQEARSILYRAVRELLINVAKHARTDAASVDTRVESGRIVVDVADGGAGFDPSAPPHTGLGLFSVRERLFLIGGTADVRSAPGTGTIVTLGAPLATPPAPLPGVP